MLRVMMGLLRLRMMLMMMGQVVVLPFRLHAHRRRRPPFFKLSTIFKACCLMWLSEVLIGTLFSNARVVKRDARRGAWTSRLDLAGISDVHEMMVSVRSPVQNWWHVYTRAHFSHGQIHAQTPPRISWYPILPHYFRYNNTGLLCARW